MIIKVLLVAGLLGVGYFLLQGPRHRQLAFRRMGGIGVVAVGVIAVIWPDITVKAAHLVGVKRGTDLVLYLAVLAFSFLAIALYQRIARLEHQITQLTREIALSPQPDDSRSSISS